MTASLHFTHSISFVYTMFHVSIKLIQARFQNIKENIYKYHTKSFFYSKTTDISEILKEIKSSLSISWNT